ncbi:hypothetical protein I311_02610 [Cryptococcus gattii NT-10]|nr:hypothetical protein I311_02610 [Cryptococcus gattii NT-10]
MSTLVERERSKDEKKAERPKGIKSFADVGGGDALRRRPKEMEVPGVITRA